MISESGIRLFSHDVRVYKEITLDKFDNLLAVSLPSPAYKFIGKSNKRTIYQCIFHSCQVSACELQPFKYLLR